MMGGIRRKNKCKSEWRSAGGQQWFMANVKRQRRRNEIAKQSRRANRKT